MRILNAKIDAASSILALALAVSLIVHMPLTFLYRNPPYHEFGGFDLGYWREGWAIYGSQLVIALLIRRSRYGSRPILTAVVVALIVCLVLSLATFLVALGRPPV